MKKLWAPWRMEYIGSEKDKRECVFCVNDAPEQDEKRLVLHRTQTSFVIMNRYPYNSGHLMAAPYEHISCLTGLGDEVVRDLFLAVRLSVLVLKRVYAPQGFNVGMNIGATAGAGFAEHLHVHIVPRWDGDTNFMPVLADAKVLSEDLASSYEKIKEAFEAVA